MSNIVAANLSRAIVRSCDDKAYKEEDDHLRTAYERIWINQELYHKDEPEWWCQKFVDSGDEVVELFYEQFPAIADSKENNDDIEEEEQENGILKPSEIEISCNKQLYRFDANEQTVVSIGRRSGCDIVVRNEYLSRVAALIYLLPQFKQVLVVDVGSVSGLKMVDRNRAESTLAKTMFFDRNVIALDWQESSGFELGCGNSFTVRPQWCVICMAQPREVRLNPCRHYILCVRCANRVKTCPWCKLPIQYHDYPALVHSYIK
jgi:hypothetical protein